MLLHIMKEGASIVRRNWQPHCLFSMPSDGAVTTGDGPYKAYDTQRGMKPTPRHLARKMGRIPTETTPRATMETTSDMTTFLRLKLR